MGKLKKTILILGEGKTEFFYINSLKPLFNSAYSIKPDYPKHSSIEELEKYIISGIDRGYDLIFCIIDMDNKNDEKERRKYEKIKKTYAKTFKRQKQGINCEVRFIETNRCTELFFLYYFLYTTKYFDSCEELEKAINRYCEYEKSEDFFRKHPLHQYFEACGGSLSLALANSEKSVKSALSQGRAYTYSHFHEMLPLLMAQPK